MNHRIKRREFGLTFIAAIACQIILNPSGTMSDQVREACKYVEMAIRTGKDWNLGHGNGPINHFHNASGQASSQVKTIDITGTKIDQHT